MAFDFSKLKDIFKKDKNKELEEVASITVEGGAVSSDSFVKSNLSDEDIEATKAAQDEINKQKEKKKKAIRKIIIIVILIVIVIILVRLLLGYKKKQSEKQEVMKNVSKVRVMDITSEISGSGTLKPKDSYTITSLVEGNVTGVYFELGDRVIKDQLLLTIDSSTAYRTIVNASSSIAQARDTYNQAKYEYEKLSKDYSGRTFKSQFISSLSLCSCK